MGDEANQNNTSEENNFRNYSDETGELKSIKPDKKEEDINNDNSDKNEGIPQEKLNQIIGKEKERAVKSFLKKMGFENTDELNKKLSEYKELENKNLSETDRMKKEYEELKEKYNETIKTKELNETKYLALANNVQEQHVDKVVRLSQAYEGDTIEDKIKAVLEDFPELSKKVEYSKEKTPRDNSQKGENDNEEIKFRKAFGLKS